MGDQGLSRVLAVDPGEARLGLAVSDPTGLVARPLQVIAHASRQLDARKIATIAAEHSAEMIVVGVALDQDGEHGPQARRSLRLMEALKLETDLPIEAWDESGSTQKAISLKGHGDDLDARAAAVILQEYLDVRRA
jgi:putative Holliday junction resolvase